MTFPTSETFSSAHESSSAEAGVLDIARRAKVAARSLATASTDTKNRALEAVADALLRVLPELRREQVAVVRDARMVVAPHGAGLTNIVFCRPGTTVIELSTGFWWNPCYRYIASMRGLPYRLLRLPWSAEHHDGQASDAIALLDVALAETVG